MTIAETSILDVHLPLKMRQEQDLLQSQMQEDGVHGMHAAAEPAAAGNKAGSAWEGDPQATPPRIYRATKMTRRIANLYGDDGVGFDSGLIACRHCRQDIPIGSKMYRVKRTGKCWHEECYKTFRRGGHIPPKMRSTCILTDRRRKLFGDGDDKSVLCQMCGSEIKVGMRMRRADNTGMCWHDQCYRMVWCDGMRRPKPPARSAYKISNVKWARMRSACMQCVGSHVCDEHRRIAAKYRVPRDDAECTVQAARGVDALG